MLRFLIKFLNLPSTLRIKLYPHINRLILRPMEPCLVRISKFLARCLG